MQSNKRLSGKVAVITGATRGIGKSVALRFAQEGANIVVAAKSVDENPKIPGTIHSVAKELEDLGVQTLPIQVDVCKEEMILQMVDKTMEKFGRIDILINNAGALWWKPVLETPIKRYDLINDVNSRGAFICTQAVLPHMLKNPDGGHVLVFSPPVTTKALPGKVAYCISKFGMTFLAHGLAEELKDKPFSINALWPITAIESFATKNFHMGSPEIWRKPEILADASLALVLKKPGELSGQALYDEDVLRSEGITDFAKYRCVPDKEPPKLLLEDLPTGF